VQYQLKQKDRDMEDVEAQVAELRAVLTSPGSEWLESTAQTLGVKGGRDALAAAVLRAFATADERATAKRGATAPSSSTSEGGLFTWASDLISRKEQAQRTADQQQQLAASAAASPATARPSSSNRVR
jgi:hypothetical protein